MTTINELLKLPVRETIRDLSILFGCYYDHLPESQISYGHQGLMKESDRAEIRIIEEVDFDHRRFWRLAIVFLDVGACREILYLTPRDRNPRVECRPAGGNG